jgi:biopolymer transport protein ExbD
VAIGAEGNFSVNRTALAGRSLEAVAAALSEAGKGAKETVVVISADANARHQSVVTVMEAARRVGLNQITFATQSTSQAGVK